MEIDPGRRLAIGQAGSRPVRYAVAGERMGGHRGRGVKARTDAVDDYDGKERRDAPPILPAGETSQVVGTHDPHEPHAPAAANQKTDRVVGVAGVDDGFETGDVDARIARQLPGGGD